MVTQVTQERARMSRRTPIDHPIRALPVPAGVTLGVGSHRQPQGGEVGGWRPEKTQRVGNAPAPGCDRPAIPGGHQPVGYSTPDPALTARVGQGRFTDWIQCVDRSQCERSPYTSPCSDVE